MVWRGERAHVGRNEWMRACGDGRMDGAGHVMAMVMVAMVLKATLPPPISPDGSGVVAGGCGGNGRNACGSPGGAAEGAAVAVCMAVVAAATLGWGGMLVAVYSC